MEHKLNAKPTATRLPNPNTNTRNKEAQFVRGKEMPKRFVLMDFTIKEMNFECNAV